ncbi:MAG: hypothetical protein ACE5FF_05280, partial [Saprospiraceae bacterium]
WKDGRMVGRIAGIINQLELKHIGENHARFGWLDFTEDEGVSGALMDAVEVWARTQGMVLLKGPYGFNQLDKTAMLTEGFSTLGTMSTIYNYPYYPQHLERLGYRKELEWVEVEFELGAQFPERYQRMSDLAQQRYSLHIMQPQNKSEMRKLGKHLFDLMMETYRTLPGFTPISKKQQEVYMEKYISFLRMEYVQVITDRERTPIGFGVSMPSLSKAMQKAHGKLLPFGIFHLLRARRHNDTGDLALIGVKKGWRKKGIHGIIFNETGKAFIRSGIYRVQTNPMLEFNDSVLSLWKGFSPKIYKRRRTYKKKLR